MNESLSLNEEEQIAFSAEVLNPPKPHTSTSHNHSSSSSNNNNNNNSNLLDDDDGGASGGLNPALSVEASGAAAASSVTSTPSGGAAAADGADQLSENAKPEEDEDAASGGPSCGGGGSRHYNHHFRRRLPGPPTEKLISISSNMNSHLTTLLVSRLPFLKDYKLRSSLTVFFFFIFLQAIIQERDDERERLRVQLARSREQVSALLSQSTSVRTSSVSANSPGANSRPASFISVEESSGPELSEKNHESEDDGECQRASLFILVHMINDRKPNFTLILRAQTATRAAH